ncbi:SDR family oxidoreductase, partial [Actinomyces sp. AC-20-1]
LEASVRGLAVELGPAGVRVNAVAAGPLRTPAAGAVPGLDALAASWQDRAPLGWDPDDAEPVARTVVSLLSDWLPATTGQVLRADGGMGVLGA